MKIHLTIAVFGIIITQCWASGIEPYAEKRVRQEPSRTKVVEGDELILSGDGAGCWDDEDCSNFPAEAGSGDDLITPRIMITVRPTFIPSGGGSGTSNYGLVGGKHKDCDDDEDCVEGSGAGINLVPSRRPFEPPHVWTSGSHESVTPFYARPVTTYEEDKSIMFTSKPIPPDPLPVNPERVYPKPRPPLPPRPTGPRVIVDVPKPDRPQVSREPEVRKPKPPTTITTTTYTKSSADRTALVIGLVAFILIIIVIVAPFVVFIKVRYRSTSSKAILNDRSNYQFAVGTPVTHHPIPGSMGHLNGATSLVPGEYKPSKLPKKKDLKEWYV